MKYLINEIASILHIPASTIRFWEQKGIIRLKKNKSSNYREFTISDLMTLSDIKLYKNSGLALNQIKEIQKMTPQEHKILLEQKAIELKQQQQELLKQIEKIHAHISSINELYRLNSNVFIEEDIDTEYIVSFELYESEKLQQYVDNPYLYSRVQFSDNIQEERRGLTVDAKQISQYALQDIIWTKRNNRYIVCLMKEEVTEGYPNNLGEILHTLQKKYNTGYIISRFLLCAKENDKTYDFYKTYIEIISENTNE